MKKKVTLVLAVLLIFAFAAISVQARPGEKPPQEAFDACANLSEGDACTVDTPHGEMSGICKAPPQGQEGALACVPKNGPGGPKGH